MSHLCYSIREFDDTFNFFEKVDTARALWMCRGFGRLKDNQNCVGRTREECNTEFWIMTSFWCVFRIDYLGGEWPLSLGPQNPIFCFQTPISTLVDIPTKISRA